MTNPQKRTMTLHSTAWLSLLPMIALLSVAERVGAALMLVDGRANIFGAGHSVAPEPGGGGAGLLPPVYSFSPGPGQVLTFSSVVGNPSWGQNVNGPDGALENGWTDIPSYGGISGIINTKRIFFMVGVFLGDSEPLDPAPSRLDFTDQENFLSLSPALNQMFFVGDGLVGTETGAAQRFHVPETATRLYLGFADAQGFRNLPGYYGDNGGFLLAEFSMVPEPSTLFAGALLLVPVAVSSYRLLRKKRAE